MKAPDVQTPGGNPASTNQNTDAASIADSSLSGNPGDRIAALKAIFDAEKYSLFELSDGSFVVSRWGWTRPLADLHAVANFARQITGGAK